MLAINTEEQLAIYSLGKTGTTSFLESIKDKEHWHGVGELDAQFMNELYNIPEQGVYGWTKGYVDQLTALEMLVNDRNYKPVFIVRDPWKRYVSGIMEILQDTFNVTMEHKDYLKMLNELDNETFTKQLDRLYYLSEFDKQKEFEWDIDFPYPSDFAIHYNYHVRNWLYEIDSFSDYRIIDSNELNFFMAELDLERQSSNVSDSVLKEKFETSLKQTGIYFYIERYLESESERYKKLIR